jgi:hypothetical protein
MAVQAQDHSGIGRMTLAGIRERTLEYATYARSRALIHRQHFGDVSTKAVGCKHGTHGMRTGWSDADFEEFKDADEHMSLCPVLFAFGFHIAQYAIQTVGPLMTLQIFRDLIARGRTGL